MNNDDYRDINEVDDFEEFEEFDDFIPYSMQLPYWCPYSYLNRSPMPPTPPPYGSQGQQPHGGQGFPPMGGHGQPPFGGHGQPPFEEHGQPPFGGHGQPPFGGHGQPPFGGHGQPPFGGPHPGGPPSLPPPTFIPNQPQFQAHIGFQAVDPGALRPCLFRFTYLWLRNGRQFWAWLTFVGRNSIAGYRWNGRRWIYFGIDLRQIRNFYCR